MSKYLLLLLMLLPLAVYGQMKHDANWVFGYNCGLNFDTVATPFSAGSAIFDYCSTLSDTNGLLQLYSSSNGFSSNGFSASNIRNANNNIIVNGDSVWSYVNGALALVAFSDKIFFISNHIADRMAYPSTTTLTLNYSIIERGASGWEITKKNMYIPTSKPIDGRLAIIQHANGKDWWLLNHEGFTGDNFGRPSTNNYYRFLVTQDTIFGPEIQQIGFGHHDHFHHFGDVAISRSGNLIAFSITYAGIVELYDFDRCTGLLSNLRTITSPSSQPRHRFYGIEFSPSERFLYASTGRGYEPNSIYQLDLTQSNLSASAQRLWYIQDIDTIRAGLLRLAPDGKIYLSSFVNDTTLGIHNKLGVIHNPDSFGVNSNFVPFDFELDSNCRTWYGLPLIPNYNLESIPVHAADAGSSFYYCEDDTTVKGVQIGGDTILGVTYEWQPAPGIDSLNAPSQVVKPDSSRWYYVTITDTTYTGNFSCYSRLDSVYVEVRNCADTTDIIDTVGITNIVNVPAKIFPNPTTGYFTVEVPTVSIGQTFTLINLLGQKVFETILNQDKTIIQVSFSEGIYLYRITGNGVSQSGKLLVE